MFNNIIGNKEAKEYLSNVIEKQNIVNSYMFVGKSGIGKSLFAKEYARNIMCLEKECGNTCNSCIKFNANSNPDFYEVFPDGKNIKIEQIRKMQEKIAEKPVISNKKVYIIYEADTMTEESQNCLLKTLEEPPEYVVMILIVANESKILPTIKSRCLKVKFNNLSNEEIKEYLPTASDEIIELLEGNLENVDTIDEKKKNYDELLRIVENIEKGKTLEVFNNSDLLYNQKNDIMELLNCINIILFKKNMLEAISIVEKTKEKILANNNYEMCIDYMLMNIADTLK